MDQPQTPPLLEASSSKRSQPESSSLHPLLPTARCLCVSSCSRLCGCPCKAMDQRTLPPLLEDSLCTLRHVPTPSELLFLPSSDEQGSDWSTPVSRRSLQASKPPPTALMKDDEDMDLDLDLLLTGPKNEKNLDECLGGVFDCYSPQMEDQFVDALINVNDNDAAVNEFEINDYIEPSILGCFLPSGSSGHGRRGTRRRRSSDWAEISHLFGLPKPYARRGTAFGGRKKLIRWTSHEAEMLVEGASIFGMRSWTKVKSVYFKTSFRKRGHLKDKWRDFGRACGIDVGSKKKVQPRRATLELIKGLKEKIISIYEKDAAEKMRAI